MYVCIQRWFYVCMYVCMYVWMYVWVLIDLYSLSTVPMNWSSTRPTSTPATELIIGTYNRQIESYHRPKAIMENYLSIHTFIDRSNHPSIYQSIHLSIDVSIDLSIYSSIDLSIYPPIYSSIYLSIYLSIYPFTHRSIYPSIPGWLRALLRQSR